MKPSYFRLAFGFLTVLPLGAGHADLAEVGRAGRWFPLVGLTLGVLLVVTYWVANWLFPPLLASTFVVAAWAFFTGLLHLDGLADCCDGLLVSAPRERRLEILQDPRRGTYAVVGVCLFLLLKIFAVEALPKTPLPWLRMAASSFALLFAPVFARWLLLLAARLRQARTDGLGAQFARGVTPGTVTSAALLPVAMLIAGQGMAVVATIAATAVVALAWWCARARLGGSTGDVLGLTVELAELSILLAFSSSRWPT